MMVGTRVRAGGSRGGSIPWPVFAHPIPGVILAPGIKAIASTVDASIVQKVRDSSGS